MGSGIGIGDLDWGLRLGVGDLGHELGLSNGITIDEEWGLKCQLILNIELILMVVGWLDL